MAPAINHFATPREVCCGRRGGSRRSGSSASASRGEASIALENVLLVLSGNRDTADAAHQSTFNSLLTPVDNLAGCNGDGFAEQFGDLIVEHSETSESNAHYQKNF